MHKAPQSEVRKGEKVSATLIIYCEQPIKLDAWEHYKAHAVEMYGDMYNLILLPYPLRAQVNNKEPMSVEYLEVHQMD